VGWAFENCYTALITPMSDDPRRGVDYEALQQLIDFQVAAGVSGVLAVGTTGESPTLTWDEHSEVIVKTAQFAGNRCTVIAGTGSNSTAEALESTRHASVHGLRAVLLVEPYYNGPSSPEIRKEYVEPIAREFPELEIIPYVIPGRSGTQLLPEDLAILAERCPNVNAVKEASADIGNIRRTRECCGPDFAILSGDDPLTHRMMTDDQIGACGVISVASNVAPGAVQAMASALNGGDRAEGKRLADILQPLFDVVTVKTHEDSPYGPRLCKARNPLPIKTMMRVLGMPAGPVRPPLGKMTPAGLDLVVRAARTVWDNDPEVLQPIQEAFGVDIAERLADPELRRGLCEDA
jgi:4-hydroxy-tetrahydrodipicolinate synthase